MPQSVLVLSPITNIPFLPDGLGNIIARDGGMSVDKFLNIVDALDCEVIIRSKYEEDKNKEWKL